MKLKPFIISFLVLWLLSAVATLWYGDIAKAGSFGDSFGTINALFSGMALALAVYSMILQQRQSAEFEKKTLDAMAQQAETIALIKTSLVQQADVARVNALTYLIEREEQRIERLKEWGEKSFDNDNHYSKGIKAAQERVNSYQQKVKEVIADSL